MPGIFYGNTVCTDLFKLGRYGNHGFLCHFTCCDGTAFDIKVGEFNAELSRGIDRFANHDTGCCLNF